MSDVLTLISEPIPHLLDFPEKDYCSNLFKRMEIRENPINFIDPNGLESALVNYEDWAYGFGHSGAMVQDENRIWISGDFSARKGASGKELLLESTPLKEATGGRFNVTNTGTNDLEEAIAIVSQTLNPSAELNYTALKFDTNSEEDKKILDSINKFDETYNGDSNSTGAPYQLIGNSCLNNSLEIIGEGVDKIGKSSKPNIFIPNDYYDYLIDVDEQLGENGFIDEVISSDDGC